ncbi:hypothetical protein SALBM135S_09482 [Streptomyces alboniger]
MCTAETGAAAPVRRGMAPVVLDDPAVRSAVARLCPGAGVTGGRGGPGLRDVHLGVDGRAQGRRRAARGALRGPRRRPRAVGGRGGRGPHARPARLRRIRLFEVWVPPSRAGAGWRIAWPGRGGRDASGRRSGAGADAVHLTAGRSGSSRRSPDCFTGTARGAHRLRTSAPAAVARVREVCPRVVVRHLCTGRPRPRCAPPGTYGRGHGGRQRPADRAPPRQPAGVRPSTPSCGWCRREAVAKAYVAARAAPYLRRQG